MNNETFEQIAADEKAVGDSVKWLVENDVCVITLWNGTPITVTPPNFVELEITGKGLLHKYDSRVLLMVRTGCAVNCRYCFRRHFPYADNAVNKAQWQEALDYIAGNPAINEVIFSGGDPLMAKDDHLAALAKEIAAIPHIKRLRIHTRLPVVSCSSNGSFV